MEEKQFVEELNVVETDVEDARKSVMTKKDIRKGVDFMERDPKEMKKSSTDKKTKAKMKTEYREPKDRNPKKRESKGKV